MKGLQCRSDFSPQKSHRSALKLRSKKVKRFTFLLVPSNRKSRILWDFNFLRQLALGCLDGFSIGRYKEKRESFDLFATEFESGTMRFLGGKSLRHWSPFKTWIPPLSFCYKEQSTANSNSFKIVQKSTFQVKGRLYTTGKVIQRLFIIDLYT